MEDDHKQQYKERYEREKQRGVKFFPDIIYKDLLVSFELFLLLIGLATFIGVKPEPPADPPHFRTTHPNGEAMAPTDAARAALPDDLTEIVGIGPVYAQRLRDQGIVSFSELARADAAALAEDIDVSADQVAEWVDQARSRG